MSRECVVDKEVDELVRKGKMKYALYKRIKFGRWILKEKIGDFIGCKGKVNREG